ncbi:MAG: hypothetical protein M3Z14_00640 [Candidatus Eremiobacteraeota bacterium]|nr:hypothetical protein [Candidatus Eremiobacteraeota bacterium]
MIEVTRAADIIAERLTSACAARDGAAFARQFSKDADLIKHLRYPFARRSGDSRFPPDNLRRDLSQQRLPVRGSRFAQAPPAVIIAHIRADPHMDVGPMRGHHHTLATAMIIADEERWKIAALQNTLCKTPPPLASPP